MKELKKSLLNKGIIEQKILMKKKNGGSENKMKEKYLFGIQ